MVPHEPTIFPALPELYIFGSHKMVALYNLIAVKTLEIKQNDQGGFLG